jgi:hypothetical protein
MKSHFYVSYLLTLKTVSSLFIGMFLCIFIGIYSMIGYFLSHLGKIQISSLKNKAYYSLLML